MTQGEMVQGEIRSCYERHKLENLKEKQKGQVQTQVL